ncbi:hypothetical protein HDU86_004026 [Geranomyces michiganensis]|nr:hypothetical protein HDU86_004026 [Geranomyces michiganensis]
MEMAEPPPYTERVGPASAPTTPPSLRVDRNRSRQRHSPPAAAFTAVLNGLVATTAMLTGSAVFAAKDFVAPTIAGASAYMERGAKPKAIDEAATLAAWREFHAKKERSNLARLVASEDRERAYEERAREREHELALREHELALRKADFEHELALELAKGDDRERERQYQLALSRRQYQLELARLRKFVRAASF